MKKFILAAVATVMVASPLVTAGASAQMHQGNNNNGRPDMHRPDDRGPQYRSWRKGQRFDSRYAQNYRQVDYRQHRGLKAPPRGYRYVQSGNDAVLVGITSGVIAAVIAGALR